MPVGQSEQTPPARVALFVHAGFVEGVLEVHRWAVLVPGIMVVQRFTGIAIDSVQDLRDNKTRITKPKGNNTLRRWDEVFSGTAERESA